MKNFLELLATDLKLNVVVDGVQSTHGLHDSMEFLADRSVHIDDIEILPRFWHLSKDGILQINEPFYQWYHRVSGQGWLLKPQ